MRRTVFTPGFTLGLGFVGSNPIRFGGIDRRSADGDLEGKPKSNEISGRAYR